MRPEWPHAGPPEHDFHAIACKLRLGHIHFRLDHLVDPEAQVGHGDVFLDVVTDAVDALVLEAGEVHHRLSHGLARDGAGVDACAADDLALLDDHRLVAPFGSLNSRTLARGPGADDDQIVGAHKNNYRGPQNTVTKSAGLWGRPQVCAGPPGPAARSKNQVLATREKPDGGPAADQGVCPTNARGPESSYLCELKRFSISAHFTTLHHAAM